MYMKRFLYGETSFPYISPEITEETCFLLNQFRLAENYDKYVKIKEIEVFLNLRMYLKRFL